ncbi:hypothetical protein QVD17_00133 [Tagetes erecta]|uniref:Uncharacterized protein n=1 Tax=Tagetes erecta TaxID=13708 RepID=A0AAD8L7A9_TARER|nr:hypothetical protein QVD17_00133 [Tagetes erecta]
MIMRIVDVCMYFKEFRNLVLHCNVFFSCGKFKHCLSLPMMVHETVRKRGEGKKTTPKKKMDGEASWEKEEEEAKHGGSPLSVAIFFPTASRIATHFGGPRFLLQTHLSVFV